ncbi:hypothetical protein Alg130_11088 [Pyrenophora tritici-repentis]|nr:hypothetical protein Alg130_11088 [Pyrenophora tritici-repentis]
MSKIVSHQEFSDDCTKRNNPPKKTYQLDLIETTDDETTEIPETDDEEKPAKRRFTNSKIGQKKAFEPETIILPKDTLTSIQERISKLEHMVSELESRLDAVETQQLKEGEVASLKSDSES